MRRVLGRSSVCLLRVPHWVAHALSDTRPWCVWSGTQQFLLPQAGTVVRRATSAPPPSGPHLLPCSPGSLVGCGEWLQAPLRLRDSGNVQFIPSLSTLYFICWRILAFSFFMFLGVGWSSLTQAPILPLKPELEAALIID